MKGGLKDNMVGSEICETTVPSDYLSENYLI